MAAVLVLVIACTVLTVVLPPQWQPWAQFVVTAVVAFGVTARRGGRPLLDRGTRPRSAPVDVVDLVAPDRSLVGCVEGDRVVTTAVELSAGALVTTEVGRDSPADPQGVVLPLDAVARQLDQGGVFLEGIDVVVDGRRAADGDDGDVYASLVGPLPLISRRRVRLLLRFDLARLTPGDGPGTVEALHRVITVATERLRRALVHHGMPCRVLDATELAGLYLEAEAEPASGDGLVVRPGADPRAVVDALSGIRAAGVVEVVRLRRVEGHPEAVDVAVSVGLSGADLTTAPPDAVADCHRLPGARVLPVPGEALSTVIGGSSVRRRVPELASLAPPAHGSGQILGATPSGAASTLQLAGPHLRSVLLAARPTVCRQVAFRAVAAGYRVAVITDVRDRWRSLLAIGDESRYRVLDPDSSDAGAPVDAVIWDVDGPLTEGRIDAFAGPGGPDVIPPTVIRVDEAWDGHGAEYHESAAPPDLVLDGRIEGWISVEPLGSPTYRVSVVAGPGEDAYVGPLTGPQDTPLLTPSDAGPSASPDHPSP